MEIAKKNNYSKKSYNLLKAISKHEQSIISDINLDNDFNKIIYRQKKLSVLIPVIRYAAVFLLLLSTVFLTFDKYFTKENYYHIYKTASKQTSRIVLVDGSVIFLKENSELQVPKNYSSTNRSLYFKEGNAYFKIHHDPSSKMLLRLDKIKVNVLGTSFNINQKEDFKFSLNQGKVMIEFEDLKGKDYTLTNNQNLFFNYKSKKIVLNQYSKRTLINWELNSIKFDNLDLKSITDDMSIYFEKSIEIKNKTIKDLKFNGVFKNTSAFEILKTFGEIYNFNVYTSNNKIIIE